MPTTKKKEEQTQQPVQNVSNQNQTQQTGNGYQSRWQPQIDNAVNQYMNRDPFRYDVNEDALYQQMKDMYVMQGQKAMMDTMGQSAAMTGGYGNSWAQSAGQQAYQGYIQQLNDNIPDLYQMALNQYMSEGDQMAQNIGMMMDQESFDYGRYRDQKADQKDAFDNLVGLMVNYGYEPTAEEMAAAGMTEAQKNAIMKPYYDAQAANSGGGGGQPYDPLDEDPEEVEEETPTFATVVQTALNNRDNGVPESDINDYLNAARQAGVITTDQRKSIRYTFGL